MSSVVAAAYETAGRLGRPARHYTLRKRDAGPYSWLEDHLLRLDGKEARSEYYARLERTISRLERTISW